MTQFSPADRKRAKETADLLELLDKHRRFSAIEYFEPAPKQQMFFEAGVTHRERMFRAGNGVGKSESGAYEDAMHLTGMYPDWWTGVRYKHPVKMWAACETSVLTRDVLQSKLCGPYGVESAHGTGLIPKDRFVGKPTLSRGVTDAFDTIQVMHTTNGIEDGISTCQFKSFEQGRTKFQGENLDFGHCDEEPPMDVYSEFLARIRRDMDSRMIVTFTPLHGATPLVQRFETPHPDRALIQMSLDEATWYSDTQKEKMLEGYPEHEREARRYGVPLMGEGRIFPFPEDIIREPFIDYVPPHWAKLWGVDFGVGHPFAAVLILWDRDNDVIHVHQALKVVGDKNTPMMSQPMFHAALMQRYGGAVPVAWPHDGNKREIGGTNQTIASYYKQAGLLMLPNHATFESGGYSTEAGIHEMASRMSLGKLRVSAHLNDWFEEYRTYHRKDGNIVRVRDDLMSATRIAVMAKRFGRATALGPTGTGPIRPNKSGTSYALGTHDSPFDWH